MDQSKQPGIKIDQVFLFESRFAHRKDALALPPTTAIGELPINIEAKVLGKKGERAAAIMLSAATNDDPTLLYSLHVEIAAVVSVVPGEENLDPFEYAMGMGPAAFFPFLREAVASITWKGRFGPIWLKPLNFLALEPIAQTGEPESLLAPPA
jgi:preprotein translocase subunit SecB